MSSIGPQLPPDPTKRKRDSKEDHPLSPPQKQLRHNGPSNNQEINLQDSDSDDMGPSAPRATNIGPTVGPSLPSPSPNKKNNQEIDLSDSDSDAGLQLPKPARPQPQAQPQPRTEPQPIKPSAPQLDDDDSSDDDYGPSLPSATTKRPTIGPTPPQAEAAPQRDEWMLAPPTSSGYSERDPTRMRNRKFASKPTPSGPSNSSSISSMWTETPEEKLKRQKDALLGRTATDGAGTGPSVKDQQQEERDRRIAESIEAKRGKSLYDEHSEKRKDGKEAQGRAAEEDDDPSKRAFDREKDMAVGGKIGNQQRRELVNKSANFGGRFQKGSFL